MPLETVLPNFPDAKKNGTGYKATCPSHDDKTPSLSIKEENGKVLLKCFAGCEFETILAAVGLTAKDLYPNSRPAPKTRIVATYDYRDETGNMLFQAVRLEPKKFYQRRPDGDGWTNNLNGTRRVLYRLPELLQADWSFPVFIVEGEKDVDRLREIGVTATSNPQGAGKWKDEYSALLAGSKCVVLPDNDGPGEQHAATVAKSLFPHAESVHVLRLPDLPDKGDVSDWIAKGNTAEDLYALLTGADNITEDDSKEPAGNNEPPDNFISNESGIFYRGEKSVYFICSPLKIAANTCDAENESWGRRLQFKDAQGVQHDLVIPMSLLSGDGSELRARLMDCGLIISPSLDARRKFLQYILSSKPEMHVRCVNQLGWHDGAFVLPDEVISANGNGDGLLLQNVDRAANKFKTSGSLKDWQENVGRYCDRNTRLMFAVNLAFASTILPIAEEPSGGFHIYGTSSTGKTTALLVAGSIWGGDPRKGFLETWRTTSNGLEAVAELHNHALLLLDEVSQVNPHEIGETIYSLSNGFGKVRMKRDTTARRKAEWTLLFLSSGEKTLEQITQGIGQRVVGGQEARFVNVAADAGKGYGLFDELHGFEAASDLAKLLASNSRKFYGTPIRKFLQAVCDNRPTVELRIKECRQLFQAKQSLQDASGEVYRVASRFSLVAAAGLLGSEFGVTTWQKSEILASCEQIFNEWIAGRGTKGSYDIDQGVMRVLSFITEHGSSRFQPIAEPDPLATNHNDEENPRIKVGAERVQNRAGFKRTGKIGGAMEYLILREVFEREICNGSTPTAIAKELHVRGYLRRGSEPDSLQQRIVLPELNRQRVYVIVVEELTDDPR